MKHWYQSKTIWFNSLLAVVAVAGLFGFADFKPSTDAVETIGVIVAAVNIVLRYLTQTQIGSVSPTG